MVTTQTQAISRNGISWQQFEAISQAFDGISGIRLTYCEGVLEIMPLSKFHELICHFLNFLLIDYFVAQNVHFFPSGAYTQKVAGIAEFQADLSYSFGQDKEVPDLCIEVIITSGTTDKLRKYQLRGVPEVWFYQDQQIAVYRLIDRFYELQPNSFLFPDLDLAFLGECLATDDPLSAVLKFRARFS